MDYATEQAFDAGAAQGLKTNPKITLRIVSQREGEPLEVELRDVDAGRSYQGIVQVGKAVSFAPELVGTSGLVLVARDDAAGSATFRINWGGVKE
ncbi:MAG TPA: hypothetical protein VH253_16385 [Phycisphaerae bacterium]|nr:hypothetical protein [Phycisphaerae bacterium]